MTQGCFDIETLLEGYPRGRKELKSCFHKFQPRDTVNWFEQRGVKLKKESDGRMFPVTDNSSTIVTCFEKERKKLGVNLLLKTKVVSVCKKDSSFVCSLQSRLNNNSEIKDVKYDKVILASGSSKSGYKIASTLGHKIIKPVPSLFTFQISDSRLQDIEGKGLEGLSVQNAEVKLVFSSEEFKTEGPVLITHWGLSGPAIIKLSAFAARELYNSKYKAKLIVSWYESALKEKMQSNLNLYRESKAKKTVLKNSLLEMPKRLWETICREVNISEKLKYSELSKKTVEKIESQIFNAEYQITGKGVFKEEFVTCGGVDLKEVDFRTMESKKAPGFFIVGEALDIDGITGGYNFQSAWSTGYIAGSSLAKS